jgi:hypothetical protein
MRASDISMRGDLDQVAKIEGQEPEATAAEGRLEP